jgi:hypothetical protein
MRVIKKIAPHLADGFMVGLKAPKWEMKLGNIQELNRSCMAQIRSEVAFWNGDNLRFEFLVGSALHSVALDLKSIKNLSDPKLNKIPDLEEYLYKLVTMVFKVRKGGCARAVAVEGTRSPTSSSERASSEEAEHTIQDTVKRRTRKPSERVNIAPERTPERKRPPKKKSPQDMSIANLFSDGRKCIVLAATKSSRPEFHLKNHFRECVTQTFPHSPHLRKYLESINTMFPEPQRPRKKRKSERAGSALV